MGIKGDWSEHLPVVEEAWRETEEIDNVNKRIAARNKILEDAYMVKSIPARVLMDLIFGKEE
jgi:hypothetical protein